MLNIISLQALRKKSTGPSKVAKNLIKGFKACGIPFVINGNLNAYPYLYILDDEGAFRDLHKVHSGVKILCGPILHGKKNIPDHIGEKYHFLYPSQWVKDLGDKYGWHKQSFVRPVGIDTDEFAPSNKKKKHVLVYFKTRFDRELDYCENLLKQKNIIYHIINYDDGYKEEYFKKLLEETKYVIWIGRQETQGIALQEVLSMNIPILVWDTSIVGYRSPNTEYEKKSYEGSERNEYATAAPYFNEECGIKILFKEEVPQAIETMQNSYHGYNSREYIIRNLDYKKQASSLIKLFSNIKTKNDFNKKYSLFPHKINFLITLGFIILDNLKIQYLSKYLIHLYQSLYSIRTK